MAVNKHLFFLTLMVCLLASIERYRAVYSVKINRLRLTTAMGDVGTSTLNSYNRTWRNIVYLEN